VNHHGITQTVQNPRQPPNTINPNPIAQQKHNQTLSLTHFQQKKKNPNSLAPSVIITSPTTFIGSRTIMMCHSLSLASFTNLPLQHHPSIVTASRHNNRFSAKREDLSGTAALFSSPYQP